jgi:hypothetical protein
MRGTLGYMIALYKKLGAVEVSDQWVASAIPRLQQDKLGEGSINKYLAAVKRVYEADDENIKIPVYKIVHIDHFFYKPHEVQRLIGPRVASYAVRFCPSCIIRASASAS